MSTISVHGIQPRLAGYAIILVIAALSGRMIAESLPATDLYVLSSFMPDMTEGVSSYLGGCGISLITGGGGFLMGSISRLVFDRVLGRKSSRWLRLDVAVAAIYFLLGLLLTVWYVLSYIGPF